MDPRMCLTAATRTTKTRAAGHRRHQTRKRKVARRVDIQCIPLSGWSKFPQGYQYLKQHNGVSKGPTSSVTPSWPHHSFACSPCIHPCTYLQALGRPAPAQPPPIFATQDSKISLRRVCGTLNPTGSYHADAFGNRVNSPVGTWAPSQMKLLIRISDCNAQHGHTFH